MLKINLVEKKVWEIVEDDNPTDPIVIARFYNLDTAHAYIAWLQKKVNRANTGKDIIHG
jgi:hypothetical protein